MSAAWVRHCFHGARFCGECAISFCFWALWLALGLLLALQIGIASSKELSVPDFLLRSLEERLAASHLGIRFGHAAFDPAGRILIENVRFNLPEFEDPVATARSVYVELDPWSLLAGRFEPRRVRLTGLNVFVPAMLAPSGRNEEVLHELEIVGAPDDHEIAIEHGAGYVAGVPVVLRGRFALPRARSGTQALPFTSLIAQHYATICRHLVATAERLALLEEPAVDIRLIPSATRGALARVEVVARSARWSGPQSVKLTGLRASTRLPLLGEAPTMALLTLEADEVKTDFATAHDFRLRLRGALHPAAPSFEPRGAEVTARDLVTRDATLGAPVVRVAGSLPRLRVEALTTYAGLPLAVAGEGDLAQRSGTARIDAELSPTVLDLVSRKLGRDLSRFLRFGAPARLQADATFADGWKLRGASGRFAATKIDGYGVMFDSVTGEFEGDLHRVFAHHLIGNVGENYARGSFEQDFASRDYRFLLEGRLRPLDIGPWFHEWWPNFFHQLAFPDAPPDASVEVAGRWGHGHTTQVFVYAWSANAGFRGATFDYARTLLFIRPNFIDGLEVFGTRGAGEARGTFQRHVDFATGEWSALDVDFFSTLDPATGRLLIAREIGHTLDPFVFERSPTLKVRGHFDGPAAPGGPHHRVEIDCDSVGGFSLYGFPFRNVAFTGTLSDGDLTLRHAEAQVAQGTLSGTAKLWTDGEVRRLGFDAILRDARLADAVTTVETFVAQRRGETLPAGGDRFLAGRSAVTLDAAVSAEGVFSDPYSYHGTGNALLSGSELGEVRLLGGLSQLFNFTALRFTSARTSFELAGRKLVFPDVAVTGANSAIEAHGTYALDSHQLDFKARVYPFRESKSFLQSFAGAVLTPLSTALEVKLTGPLDRPAWAFVIGPTNFLRSLLPSSTPPEETAPKPTSTPPYLTR